MCFVKFMHTWDVKCVYLIRSQAGSQSEGIQLWGEITSLLHLSPQ